MNSMLPSADSPGGHPQPIRPAHDPEFDPRPRARRSGTIDDTSQAYQRLVVNPFLAFLALIAWVALTRFGYREQAPARRSSSRKALPVLAFFAVQYPLPRLRGDRPALAVEGHACEASWPVGSPAVPGGSGGRTPARRCSSGSTG